MHNTWLYILTMVAVTYLIRVLPFTLIRKPITSNFLKSFLFYVPYVTLAVMTFPSIVHATKSPLAGTFSLIVGVTLAWFGATLFRVAIFCSLTVLITEFLLAM